VDIVGNANADTEQAFNQMTKSNCSIAILLAFSITYSLSSCNQIYKAGNLIALSYPVETQLRSAIVSQYLDTLRYKQGFDVPEKWRHYDKLVDLDSINNKRIYFKANPEEMYLVSFGGMLQLMDVYNPLLTPNDWVAERSRMPKEEEERILKRFQTEVLDVIDSLAKRDNLPDTLIYK
jgi:hypothetical protein